MSAGSEAGGGGKGGNDQAITYPPRGVCLREALSVLHEAVNPHKTVEQPKLHASRDSRESRLISKTRMIGDGDLTNFYTWAFNYPKDWLDVPSRNLKFPNEWIHTPLTAITKILEKAMEALRQARDYDEAKKCVREFMEQAGPGPNVILSESKGILSNDACSSPDLVALAKGLHRYSIQSGANIPGSFLNVHSVDANSRIRMENGSESAPCFQDRGSDATKAAAAAAAAAGAAAAAAAEAAEVADAGEL